MKLKTERDLSYIDPLTVEFFQNNGTSSISVILLTNGLKDGRTQQMVTDLKNTVDSIYKNRGKNVERSID